MALTTEKVALWKRNADVVKSYATDMEVKILQDRIIELADEVLANREAQPVAWRHDDGPFAGIAITRAKSVADSWIAKGWTVTPLYTAPPAPAVPDDYQHLKNVQELYHSQEERLFALAQRIKGASFDKYSHTTAQAIDVLEREIFGDDDNACRAAMLDGYK